MTEPNWSRERALHTYSIPFWSDGYFDIDARGRLCALPQGVDGPALPLGEVLDRATSAGLKLPLLLRFSDILRHRLQKQQASFRRAMEDNDYTGGYTSIYPIKVNQHFGVAGELSAAGEEGFGLEAGSKPELMAVLGLAKPNSLVICNGYKDREYIRLALLGRKLGLQTFIVVEKPSEVRLALEEARALGVEPGFGVRVRLASVGSSKWQDSGGDKAKFGLSARQLMALVDELRTADKLACLQLLHFHMGSQISNVRDIASGMREAVQHFVQLSKHGFTIRYVDTGGGFGVDYEGTRSRSHCSINYSLDQFAHTLVQPLAEACALHGLPQPRLLTETGRAMTAHHALMVVNVVEVEHAPEGAVPDARDGEPLLLHHLRESYGALDERPPTELYLEAQQALAEAHAAFALGQLSLAERARAEDLFYAIAHGVRARLRGEDRSHRAMLDELNGRLVDKYFANFSIFESVPDVWAINQVFPIAPLCRLDEAPQRRAVIKDLTCDSDGRIDTYVEAGGLSTSLPLHSVRPGESYRLGIFLVGAYQETLGDIHNLFGDTDTVSVRLQRDGGYSVRHERRADTADVLLDYVGYGLDDLRARYRQKVELAALPQAEAQQALQALEAGLTSSTYLREHDRPDTAR